MSCTVGPVSQALVGLYAFILDVISPAHLQVVLKCMEAEMHACFGYMAIEFSLG